MIRFITGFIFMLFIFLQHVFLAFYAVTRN